MICFNEAPYFSRNVAESRQATRVLEFREEFRGTIRGLELVYNGGDDFRDQIRDYLEKYLRAHYPITPGRATAAVVAGDPSRYVNALPRAKCARSSSDA